MNEPADRGEATRLHRRAMELADEADLARRHGDEREASRLLTEALDQERSAAAIATEEPSRSVLHRSAATLALELGHFRDAERLVAQALAAEPPDEIAEELRDVLEQVYFSRHLDLRGMVLGRDELQMSIAGDAVGFGIARSERFLKRVEDVQRLLYRTAERQAGQPFREKALPAKVVRDELEVYVSVPRAASLAVSFRLARPRGQEVAFPRIRPQSVVAAVLSGLESVNSGDDEALRHQIEEPAYRRNFMGLAKQIAPDGRAVSLVGFTAPGEHGERRLEFRRLARQISVGHATESADARTVQLEGKILFADGRRASGQIQIVTGGTSQSVRVPSGMMTDIVRPLWDVNVVAICARQNGRLTLVEVRRKDD